MRGSGGSVETSQPCTLWCDRLKHATHLLVPDRDPSLQALHDPHRALSLPFILLAAQKPDGLFAPVGLAVRLLGQDRKRPLHRARRVRVRAGHEARRSRRHERAANGLVREVPDLGARIEHEFEHIVPYPLEERRRRKRGRRRGGEDSGGALEDGAERGRVCVRERVEGGEHGEERAEVREDYGARDVREHDGEEVDEGRDHASR